MNILSTLVTIKIPVFELNQINVSCISLIFILFLVTFKMYF